MELLIPCFVKRGGFLYTVIVPGGKFLRPSSFVPGGWFWMKLIAALYSNKIKCKICQSKFQSVDKESVAHVNAGILVWWSLIWF